MDILFFGDFLYKSGLVSFDQLNQAVDYRLQNNRSIGELAIEQKLLDNDEIKKIKNIQRVEDKKFGRVAVEHNLLTQEQLDMLLEKQKSINIFIGDAFIKLGILTADIVDEQAKEFEQIQKNKFSHIYTELAFCDNQQLLKDSVRFFNTLFYRRFQEYIKFQKIDFNNSSINDKVFLFQSITGDIDIDYILSFEKKVNKYTKQHVSNENELEELVSTLLLDMSRRMALFLTNNGMIVKNNSKCIVKKPEQLNLRGYNKLQFVTTLCDMTLYIKV